MPAPTFIEVDAFPPFDEIGHGDLFAISLSNNTTRMTHGLHRFAAKFIPQIPSWALANFAADQSTVLDPFMGSGTTIVEGLTRGGATIGLDIDPLTRLIARAKSTAVSHQRIEALGEVLRAAWTAPAVELRAPMEGVKNFEHWFSPEPWSWVQSLHSCILTLGCSPEERTFLLAVFSSTLRRVSNADDQTQKTYVSGTRPKTPPSIRSLFWRHFDRSLAGLTALNAARHPDATVVIPEAGDATRIPLEAGSVGLAITSPPYLDSVDYMYNMMVEYFWLGPHLGVPDRRTFNHLRREHLGAKRPNDRFELPEEIADLIDLDKMPVARRPAAATYFVLMARHFAEIARCLEDDARYVFVVGNSQTLDGTLPLHNALVRLARAAGLALERAFGYRIRRHYMKFPRAGRGGIILIDWVLVLRKHPPGAAGPPLPMPELSLEPDEVAN